MIDKKITDVDYIDSLNSDESFFVNKNSSIKQINKSNIVFGINNGGTGATTVEEARENLGAASLYDLSNLETSISERISESESIIENDLLTHKSNVDNPHNVSPEQIGAALKPISFSITVPASGWGDTSKKQEVDILYDTTDKNIIVTPNPDFHIAWMESVVRCSNQNGMSLEFACEDIPSKDIKVNVLMLG